MSEVVETTTSKETKAAKRIREDSDQDIRTWLTGMAGDSSLKVSIIRKAPTAYKGYDGIDGTVESVEELIDEDYIRDRHGGGTYKLQIFHNPKGKWVYLTAKTIKIAGPPKLDLLYNMDEVETSSGNGQQVHDSGSGRVLDAMERLTERANNRADRAEGNNNSNGFDMASIQILLDPIQRQLEAAQQANADLRDKLVDTVQRKPDTTVQDGLIGRMWDGESARIESVRTNHESELRQRHTSHEDQLKRTEDRHRDEIKSRDRAHERELSALEKSTDAQGKALAVAHESRIDGLKAENKRLDRELGELKKELGELRAKKDMSIADKAQEIMSVKDALKAIGGGDDDGDKDEKWYEKVISAALDQPDALGRIFGTATGEMPPGTEAPAQPQAAATPQHNPPEDDEGDEGDEDDGAQSADASGMPPVGRPFKMPDGKVYVRHEDGSIVPWKKPPEAETPAEAAPPAEGAAPPEPMPPAPAPGVPPGVQRPDESEVFIAINFMENAIKARTDPAIFAQTARNLIPPSILSYMKEVGVDAFLNEVAHLDSSSPLATDHGRKFARQVAKFLLEGVVE